MKLSRTKNGAIFGPPCTNTRDNQF